MQNIVEIKNVKNVVTEEIGTMYLIASKDREAVQCDNVNHQGLSIFFRPDGEKVEYVKSYVFTDQEARLMRRGRINTIRDIGYYLDVTNATMDIICLESGMDKRISNDSMFGTQKITRVVFSLEFTDLGHDKLVAEARENMGDMCGFRLAVSKAFNEMVNITDDTIVPTIFPDEANVLEFDYMVE